MLRSLSISSLFVLVPIWAGPESRAPLPMAASLHGVDVSHYQKQIDWDSVAEREPVDFAFVKATEGHDYVDSLFSHNWYSLKRLGIRRGAYHFFRAYGCGDEQANLYLSLVEMQPGDLAPVLDIERLDGIAPEVMIEEASIWLHIVERKLGVKPIIYSNQHFYETYLAGHFDDFPLWIARYSDEKPLLATGRQWDFWQFSNEGCIEGIFKKVDLNIFPGTQSMLDRLCWYPKPMEVDTPSAICNP